MIVPFRLSGNYDLDPHHFRVYEAISNGSEDWLEPLAEEYVRVLTDRATRLKSIKISEDTDMDMSRLKHYMIKASIPKYELGNFNVVRSDFGELLCYMLLEQDYGTMFGEKSISGRELRDRPGRGIDAIGVEESDLLTLVLCEVKVSDEQSSPPGVVDSGRECLSRQHHSHMDNLKKETKDKVWRAVSKTRNQGIADLLATAAVRLEENRFDEVRIIVCSVLVRPKAKHKLTDFGSFRANPARYSPAIIRFLVACIPGDVDDIIKNWHNILQKKTEVSG
jgi:hypothetical protein